MFAELKRSPGRWIAVVVGFTATVGQVVLLREFLSVVAGNELVLGLVLAGWLFWTAVGSQLGGRLVGGSSGPRSLLILLQILVAVALPGALLVARGSRALWPAVPGELPGPLYVFCASVLVLAPFCLASGAEYLAASRLVAHSEKAETAQATSTVYGLEALGSALGGLLASFWLIDHFSGLEISCLLGGLSLWVVVALIRGRPVRLIAAAAALGVSLGGLSGSAALDRLSLSWLWPGMKLLESCDSDYARLSVVQQGEDRSLYENGVLHFTRPDVQSAQESVHFALLQHPRPKKVLLVGGGLNGALEEALQHPSIENLDYVELDPKVVELGRRYFAGPWLDAVAAGRVRLHEEDGRWFIRRSVERFDVLIVNLPDPRTAQLNRFYTREFFAEAAARLAPAGVLAFSVSGAENYLSDDLSAFLACIRRTLREVFPDVRVMPGEQVHFFAAAEVGSLTLDGSVLAARYDERRLQAPFASGDYLPFRLSRDRVEDLDQALTGVAEARINQDFNPVAFYLSSRVWAQRFGERVAGLARWVGGIRFPVLMGTWLALCGLTFIGMGRWAGEGGARRLAAATAAGCTGFSLLGGEVLLLIGFQSLFGYLYHGLALIVAAFMVGLAWGNWRALLKLKAAAPRGFRGLVQGLLGAQTIVILSVPALVGCFHLLARILESGAQAVTGGIVFSALAFGVGAGGGCVFPWASRLFFLEGPREGGRWAVLYAADLCGAALGAALISWIFLPVFGFWEASLVIGAGGVLPAGLCALLLFRWMND